MKRVTFGRRREAVPQLKVRDTDTDTDTAAGARHNAVIRVLSLGNMRAYGPFPGLASPAAVIERGLLTS